MFPRFVDFPFPVGALDDVIIGAREDVKIILTLHRPLHIRVRFSRRREVFAWGTQAGRSFASQIGRDDLCEAGCL